MRLPRALHGNALAKIFNPFFVFVENFVLFGTEPAWGETIDRDSMGTPVIRQTHCELANATAARSVGTETGVSGNTCDRADIDDASVVPRDHAPRNGLGDKKTAAQISVEDFVPVIPGDIDRGLADVAACVIDKNVEMPKRIFRGCNHSFNARLIAHVEFKRDGVATAGFNLVFKC